MIKTVIFDADGVVIRRKTYFSDRFSREFGVPIEKIIPFFKNEFRQCLAGKADLKEELKKYLARWEWKNSIDDLLIYWFANESDLDRKMLKSINILKESGKKCYLATDNEKYRLQYILNNLGLINFFDGVFASAKIGFQKSQPEFWPTIHKLLGKPDKSEILVWDDDLENVKSSRCFGFNSELYSGFEAYKQKMNSLIA